MPEKRDRQIDDSYTTRQKDTQLRQVDRQTEDPFLRREILKLKFLIYYSHQHRLRKKHLFIVLEPIAYGPTE